MNPSGLPEAIDRVAAEVRWEKKEVSPDPNKAIGKGFACFWKAPAMPPNAASSAFIKFNEDGSLNISASGMEIGQGYLTVMAKLPPKFSPCRWTASGLSRPTPTAMLTSGRPWAGT